MTYLQDIETAANPAPIAQSNFEEIEDELWFLRPTLVSGVETTTIGAPGSGTFVADEIWTDALLAKFVCTSGGSPGSWLQITPAPVAADPSTGTIPTGYLIWNVTDGLHKIHDGGYVWTELGGGGDPFDPDGNFLINSASAPADLEGGIAWALGVAPSADVVDQVSLWVGDRAAGEAGLRLRSESGVLHHIGDRVGLGTLSPDTFFHINGATHFGGNLLIGTATVPTSLAGGVAMVNGTAPSANLTDGVSLWVGDRTAGEAGLRMRSESGVLNHFGDFVGIGTLSPLAKLTIDHSGTTPNLAAMMIRHSGITYPDLSALFSSLGWSGSAGWNGHMGAAAGATGGLGVFGVTSAGTGNGRPVIFTGYHGSSGSITESACIFRAAKSDGSTSAAALAAGEPCIDFRNWTASLMLLNGSGNMLLNAAANPSSLASGIVMVTGTAATGTVAAGQMALWFDGTNLRARIGTTNYTFTKT